MIKIPILEIRTFDIWVLLLVGTVMEVLTKSLYIGVKLKSSAERSAEAQMHVLNDELAKKRRLGPSAFVETSKLERKVLAKEKQISEMVDARKRRTEKIAKFVKQFSFTIYAVVFAFYYGHSILSIDGTRVGDETTIVMSNDEEKGRAIGFLQGFLFPLSYIGLGMRVARFGLPTPGFGPLLVLWGAQVTVGNLMDGFEFLI
mmetsp:Transcript_18966/g.28115  ORF Transcript_18966/g.28115 Transcript_18966/m.28115 type:complete len:202 (+) Transcript_18966:130-735(+)|eukprot:CAMPEP_0194203460 /NCGR_PEP_ID=MMETSP0156-20130528/3230_1 /TAXON_ID=33649 /ORGANISM="Thalassionema nitzschioides, Strain L26-B" /LENGTH=201 /DNA_ID=CAMNT_0038929213 /DNA_START=103 /DNA_END=708 /DNA_ORIENTATION=+